MTCYRHVLIATDYSDEAERALVVGAQFARRCSAQVTLAHAYDATPYMRLLEPRNSAEAKLAMRDAAAEKLGALRDAHLDGLEVDIAAVSAESPAMGICDHAEKVGADVIVVGTRGRGTVMRVLVGSVAERIIRHAKCDVLVVRGNTDGWSPSHMVAPTDLSEVASVAIEATAVLHGVFESKVSLLHVYDDDVPVPAAGAFKLADTAVVAANLKNELDTKRQDIFGDDENVDSEVLVGEHPADIICKWCEDNDANLVIVSSHGRTGLAHVLMGSVAEQIIRYAPCPALAIRVRPEQQD
jgi:nucleotide-binding universal stress UspA family protein